MDITIYVGLNQAKSFVHTPIPNIIIVASNRYLSKELFVIFLKIYNGNINRNTPTYLMLKINSSTILIISK